MDIVLLLSKYSNSVSKDLPDYILINECQIGNVKAFDILFERYFNKLHYFAIGYLKDRSLAEEIVMDIMTRLWEKSDNFITEASLGPFLYRSVKNAIVDHYRKRSLDTVPLLPLHDNILATSSTDGQVLLDELQKSYRSSLEMLSPQRRLVFEMNREQNMTYPQIAKNLNLSIKTVESHISAALSYLRKNMRSYTNGLLLFFYIDLFF